MPATITLCLALIVSPQDASKPTTVQKNQKARAVKHPLSDEQRKFISDQLKQAIETTTKSIKKSPTDSRAISARGDVSLFAGKFKDAVRDYDRLVEFDPSMDKSHWRRGIAYFYAGDFDKAAKQFERYHVYDNVDRENGIWRYLSQYKAKGRAYARKGLLKYRKDDREPFPAVYKLFAGEIKPDQILQQIKSAKVSPTEREKRIFYAELYIGLNELVEGRRDSAASHLSKAVATEWPRSAGFGPNYMWQVGRVQLDLLLSKDIKVEQNTKTP